MTLWNSKTAGDAFWMSGRGQMVVESVREFLSSDPSLTEYVVELHGVNAKDLPLPRTATESMRRARRIDTGSRGGGGGIAKRSRKAIVRKMRAKTKNIKGRRSKTRR